MNYAVENSEFVAWAEMEMLFQVNKFHAVLCDPPYGIAFMGKEWDEVVGIEMDAEYCKIAEARLNYHKNNKIVKEEK